MNFLIELGINKSTIDKILKHNGLGIQLSIENNKENITKIIKYFREIGILNIDELLIYEIDVFLENYDSIRKRINKDLVDLINDDYTFIE